MPNISKKRKWLNNEYDTYRFNRRERGQFLNVWFPNEVTHHTLKLKNKVKHNVLSNDNLWTIKKVDEDTYNHLYRRWYNPVFIRIGCDFTKSMKLDRVVYNMKAHIMSIDDSSYGIWWDDKSLEFLYEKRLEMMKWIDAMNVLNGEEFFEVAISLGADSESKDYN